MHIGQDTVQQVSSNFCHSIDGISLLKLEGHLTLEGGARGGGGGRESRRDATHKSGPVLDTSLLIVSITGRCCLCYERCTGS